VCLLVCVEELLAGKALGMGEDCLNRLAGGGELPLVEAVGSIVRLDFRYNAGSNDFACFQIRETLMRFS